MTGIVTMEPQDYDWPNGCCPKCDCEVGMDVQEVGEFTIRFICPDCGYYEDFDDSPDDNLFVMPIIPPYGDIT